MTGFGDLQGMCKCGHAGTDHSAANGQCYYTRDYDKTGHRSECACGQFRPVIMLTKDELRAMIAEIESEAAS